MKTLLIIAASLLLLTSCGPTDNEIKQRKFNSVQLLNSVFPSSSIIEIDYYEYIVTDVNNSKHVYMVYNEDNVARITRVDVIKKIQ